MRGLVGFILALMLVIGGTRSPAPVSGSRQRLSALLPGYPEGGSTVVVTNDGVRTLEEHAAIFSILKRRRACSRLGLARRTCIGVYEDTQADGSGTRRPISKWA